MMSPEKCQKAQLFETSKKVTNVFIQIFRADVRFEIRRSQCVLTIANPMKVLVRFAATNPDIKVRRATSAALRISS